MNEITDFVDAYKKLNVQDKKIELLNRVKTISDNYREVCANLVGIDKKFVVGNLENVDVNNEDELLNALFSYVIEIDSQVGVFVDKAVE